MGGRGRLDGGRRLGLLLGGVTLCLGLFEAFGGKAQVSDLFMLLNSAN